MTARFKSLSYDVLIVIPMAKSNVKYSVFALELVASLIFLGITFTMGTATNTFAQIWLPLLYGAAVIGSISLFLISFGTVMAKSDATFAHEAMWATAITGFALVILTYGAMLPYLGAIVGLLIGLIGTYMAKK